MPTPVCPACRAPHQLVGARPGTMLICDKCQEVFPAGTDVPPRAKAVPVAKAEPRWPGPDRRRRDPEPARTSAPAPARVPEPPPMPRTRATTPAPNLGPAPVPPPRPVPQAARADPPVGVPFPPPRFGPGSPQPPAVAPEPAGPPDPAFVAPTNPFKAGTQTRLRELRSVTLPKLAPPKTAPRPWEPQTSEFQQLVFLPAHNLLFAREPQGVWVYDLKANRAVGTLPAKEWFTDLSVAPGQSAVFAADYGGERTGYGDPVRPSWVHKFDPAGRTWETRKAPRIAYRLEAVDRNRVLLLEQDQWVDVTLNR